MDSPTTSRLFQIVQIIPANPGWKVLMISDQEFIDDSEEESLESIPHYWDIGEILMWALVDSGSDIDSTSRRILPCVVDSNGMVVPVEELSLYSYRISPPGEAFKKLVNRTISEFQLDGTNMDKDMINDHGKNVLLSDYFNDPVLVPGSGAN